jgi:hypothetical protein
LIQAIMRGTVRCSIVHKADSESALPDAALEAIRADLESEELPSKELHGPSDSGQRTRLAEALDIIRMELDGPMSNEPVPSAASAEPGRLDGVAAIRSAMDGNDEEEGRGSDDPVMPDGATSPETRAEPIKELPAVTAIASAPLLPESRWWSRFVPRRRRRTT